MENIRKYLGGGDSEWAGRVILSVSERRNAYQEKAPLGAKTCVATL